MGLLFAFLKVLAVQLVVSLLQPKPKLSHAQPYDLSKFQVPTATEDRAQPIPFGTVCVAGNVIHYGDYLAQKKTKRVRTGLFSKKSVTVGFRYHIGQWIHLSATLCDQVREVRYGDKVVWSGALDLSRTATTPLQITQTWNSTQGQEVPDGFIALVEFFNQPRGEGAFTPLPNPYMQSQLGADAVPAYPDALHVVVHGPSSAQSPGSGFVGPNVNIPPLRVTVRRMPDVSRALNTSAALQWPVAGVPAADPAVRTALTDFVEPLRNIEGDANIALAALEIMTTARRGVGPSLAPETFDLEDYLRCAQTLHAEGNGASFEWGETRPVGEIVDALMQQAGALPRFNTKTGQIGMRLIRETDTPVYTFDSSNTAEIGSMRSVSTEETVNEVHVPFVDRYLDWTERTLIAQDPAGKRAAGASIVRAVEFIGVSRETLARLLATRELRTVATPLRRVRWTGMLPPEVVLQPGDLVELLHPRLGQTLRMRLIDVRFASFENGTRVELEGIEDVFRAGTAGTYLLPPPPEPPPVGLPTALNDLTLLLAPYALTGNESDQLLLLADDPNEATDEMQGVLQESSTVWNVEADYEYFDDDYAEPCIAGTSAVTLSDTTDTISWTLSDSQLEQFQRLSRDTVLVLARDPMLPTIWSAAANTDHEWMQARDFVLDGNTLTATVVRGVFDTVPLDWTVRPRLVLGFCLDTGALKTRRGAGDLLEGLSAAVVRYESRGVNGFYLPSAPEFDTAGERSWQFEDTPITARACRPLRPARVRLNEAVAKVFRSLPAPSFVTLPTAQRGETAVLAWNNRNRLLRTVTGYFSTEEQPEPGTVVWYRVGYVLAQEQSREAIWGPWQEAEEGATSAELDWSALGVPADSCQVMAQMYTRRALDTGVVDSPMLEVAWQLEAAPVE